MKQAKIILFGLLMLSILLSSCNSKKKIPENTVSAVPVIFDTDFGPDYDDVGAIALLHAFADSGYVKILATVGSCKDKLIAPALNVINTYFGKPGIPIGIPKGEGVYIPCAQHWNDSIVRKYPHNISTRSTRDAVDVYREQLSKQPDKSVVIITVGFFTNLAALLKSAPDEYSELNGNKLVAKKVKKLVSMAGIFPEGREFNVEKDSLSTKYAIDNWPSPIVFSGFEIGSKIVTGLPLVKNSAIRNSPVKDVFRISLPFYEGDKNGRMSWDETAVLIACKGISPYFNSVKGQFITFDDGHNGWKNNPLGNHEYVTFKMPKEKITETIDKLMMHQPVKNNR
jgi:inosine-uridine nucleoside N-ribohydrolase